MTEPHQHQWRTVAHVDSCHGYSCTYVCDCGAIRETYGERDVSEDGWSNVWMMDDGGAPMCKRCEELLAGAKPEYRDETRAAAG